jgi:hypothetical protein
VGEPGGDGKRGLCENQLNVYYYVSVIDIEVSKIHKAKPIFYSKKRTKKTTNTQSICSTHHAYSSLW